MSDARAEAPWGKLARLCDHDTLARACAALAVLVKDEYPAGYGLDEIASTWSAEPRETVIALAAIESVLRPD